MTPRTRGDIGEVFISYIDDSNSDKGKKVQLTTAVLIADQSFNDTEGLTAGQFAAFIPEEKQDAFFGKFHEFKSWELFRQKGPFEGIDKKVCLQIMRFLLLLVQNLRLPVIFGALDKERWATEKSGSGSLWSYGGADPLDICFRGCLKGIASYMEHNHPDTFALIIADWYEDRKVRELLQKSFLDIRKRFRPKVKDLEITHSITHSETGDVHINVEHKIPTNEMPYLHDAMYFGDSRYSIGIQLADLCGYIIGKHLANDPDPDLQGFYALIEPQIMYSRIEPGGQLIGHDIRVSELRLKAKHWPMP